MKQIVKSVEEGSIAWEMEIEPGDALLAINDKEIQDVFDYRYLVHDEYLVLLVEKNNGEEWELEIEKDYDEDLGLDFGEGIMSEYRSCANACIFCFIDQMPPGMRETLYFKDDDSRLSFLQGNYITLTNMSDEDVDRIIRLHLAPINISVQSMNPKIRVKMLHHRQAGEKLKYLKTFAEHGIEMNGQVVLCKGVNDGNELCYTIEELLKLAPAMQSCSVVPSGLTKYREKLFPLKPFTKEDACEVIDVIEGYQKEAMEKFGSHFIHASDEWYVLAERELPDADNYDGYIQLENGVGMMRLLHDEVMEELAKRQGDDREITCSMATGVLAYPLVCKLCRAVEEKYPKVKVHVYEIQNDFFGRTITVSGLITGGDLMKQLKGQELGDRLLLPTNMLRSRTSVFLDDVTVDQVETSLQTTVNIVESSGDKFVRSILDELEEVQEAEPMPSENVIIDSDYKKVYKRLKDE